MKISIITPSYNQGKFIQKCIDSVRSQNTPVEHIILDNCSTDQTSEILDCYRFNSDKVSVNIIVESDKGQTAAINKGFQMATGDIICWLNTDEYYYPSTLQQVYKFFSENPDIDVLFGNCDFVDPAGNLIKHKREYFYSESMLIFYGCFIPSCATFVRRTVIDNDLLLDPEFKVTMDFDWYVRIAKAGYKFAHLPISLAAFTWHETNISSTFVEKRKSERRLVQERYSGVIGPYWVRSVVLLIMKYFWISVRVIKRLIK